MSTMGYLSRGLLKQSIVMSFSERVISEEGRSTSAVVKSFFDRFGVPTNRASVMKDSIKPLLEECNKSGLSTLMNVKYPQGKDEPWRLVI